MATPLLSRDAISRVVRSSIAADLRTLRPREEGLPHATEIGEDFATKEGPLGLDSLEFMTLATSVASQFNLFESDIQDSLLRYRTLAGWYDVLEKAPIAPHVAVSFASSGTTGAPKRMKHPLEWLGQEVEAWTAMLSGIKRVVVLCPAHHIYGFIWGVLLPARLGVPVIDMPLERIVPNAFQPGDLLIATPPVWRYLAQTGYAFSEGIVGVTSTAPMPADIAQTVVDHGLATLYQIYGSSETAGVAWRTAPEGDYTLMEFWSKPDSSLADGQLARRCPDGLLRLYPTMDRLQWSDAQHFTVLGRVDQSIQIGGHNVSLQWVESELKTNPNVRDAAVRPFAPGASESRLKAYIVLKADEEQARHDFTFWLQTTLPAHARPKSLRFGSAVPTNTMGKRADWVVEENTVGS
jgi:long-chain acyl-CoA synthetase